jgi:release factor glutamine methyltransferase
VFLLHDILHSPLSGQYDAIVSNPPYIPSGEQETMERSVVDFEPHAALFVPDDDPLKFYEAIAEKAEGVLLPDGIIAVEINEQMGPDVEDVFNSWGYDTLVITDLDGKDRVVLARGE